MAKSRCFPTNFFYDPAIMSLSSGSIRMVLVGLVLIADDHGRGCADLGILARQIDSTPAEVETALREIEQHKLVQCYQVDGYRYYSLTRWQEWQNLRRPVASQFPTPPCTYADQPEADQPAYPQQKPESFAQEPPVLEEFAEIQEQTDELAGENEECQDGQAGENRNHLEEALKACTGFSAQHLAENFGKARKIAGNFGKMSSEEKGRGREQNRSGSGNAQKRCHDHHDLRADDEGHVSQGARSKLGKTQP